jgi:hypothetical protein
MISLLLWTGMTVFIVPEYVLESERLRRRRQMR